MVPFPTLEELMAQSLLPSERFSPDVKRRHLIAGLADAAMNEQWLLHHNHRPGRPNHEKVIKWWKRFRPGAFIEKQPEHVRAQLRELRSEDMERLATGDERLDPHWWNDGREVGIDGKPRSPATVWKIGGHNPDRTV